MEEQIPQEFDVVIEQDAKGNFVATVPTLHGCHTQSDSLDELMERAEEAIKLCLEAEAQPPERLRFIGVHRVRLA